MTRDKDLKRLVRARMKKTGEAYTAARAQITRASRPGKAARAGIVATAETSSAERGTAYATLAGMSDTAIKAKTGCDWERWVKTLDHCGAEQMSHSEIAALVDKKWKTGGWWAQSVTVGYERIKGLRAHGQRRDGTFEASKSRTFDVPVEELFDAWADTKLRKRWLDVPDVKVRTATRSKALRLGLGDGSIVAVGFTPKGDAKSSVAVQHTKLADRETVNRLKQYWSEQFDALAALLERSAERARGRA